MKVSLKKDNKQPETQGDVETQVGDLCVIDDSRTEGELTTSLGIGQVTPDNDGKRRSDQVVLPVGPERKYAATHDGSEGKEDTKVDERTEEENKHITRNADTDMERRIMLKISEQKWKRRKPHAQSTIAIQPPEHMSTQKNRPTKATPMIPLNSPPTNMEMKNTRTGLKYADDAESTHVSWGPERTGNLHLER
ncbi:hypothetical protein C0J52_27623 [Blattella germanica]|nr:hypothetical protein C0J52_27623 [Blattella germanica]